MSNSHSVFDGLHFEGCVRNLLREKRNFVWMGKRRESESSVPGPSYRKYSTGSPRTKCATNTFAL
jgi:hypothetical protein